MSTTQKYVTGIALSQFVHGARSMGLEVNTYLKDLGLSQDYLLPTARVPESQYEMFLLYLMTRSNNASFGLDIGQHVIPPLYGVLMSLAFGSSSLGEAISYLARYQGLATGNCGALEYAESGDAYKLSMSMSHTNPVIRRQVSECVMAFFSMLPNIITGRNDVKATRIALEHESVSPAAKRYVESVLGCPVEWGSEDYSILVSRRNHEMAIFGHGEEMLKAAERLAQDQLDKINNQQSLLEKVTWHIEEQIQTTSPRREEIAKRLNMSVRTLDRRLEVADTSWQELLDQIRLRRATELLSSSDLSMALIAEKIGFSDVRSFQRKFKVWTGKSPSDYRANG